LLFSEDETKPMVCNNENWMTIEAMYGEDSDDWHGKRIELYNDPSVMFGKKRTGGIRVREPRNGHAPATPNIFATLDAPLAYVNEHGFAVERSALVEALRSTGANGWNAARDSEWLLKVFIPSQPEVAF
jgi:hypothetical protein